MQNSKVIIQPTSSSAPRKLVGGFYRGKAETAILNLVSGGSRQVWTHTDTVQTFGNFSLPTYDFY